MCGIAGIHFKNPEKGSSFKVDRMIDELLLGIEHRGGDATGMVAVTAGGEKVVLHKDAVTASEFIKDRPSVGGLTGLRTVLLHTRFATQGHQSKNENNHPVLFRTCFATHNGHIGNDSELFGENDELTRNAEVDSIAIAAMFSKHGLDKAHLALQVLEGSMAIAVIDPIVSPDKLVLAKGYSSPLIYFENSEFIIWASTLDTLRSAWGSCLGTPPTPKKFWELQEGHILFIEGADAELMSFKPKRRKYVSKWSGNTTTCSTTDNGTDGWGMGWSHYGTEENRAYAESRKRDCASCGCSAFWHSGSNFGGNCLRSPAQLNGRQCKCVAFVRKEGEPENTERCDSCYDYFPEYLIEEVYADFHMCEGCLNVTIDADGRLKTTATQRECKHSDCGTECQDKSETGKALVLVSSRTCSHPSCDDDMCIKPFAVDGVKVFAEEDEAEPGIWVPTGGEEDNATRHASILARIAKDTGFNASFIQWLLFDASMDRVSSDPWLKDNREIFDTAYAEVEMDFNDLEAIAYAESH